MNPMPPKSERPGGLLKWQYGLYPGSHVSRENLLLHACTEPVYLAGTLILLGSLLTLRPLGALAGLAMMAATMAAQKKGHGTEAVTPSPFRGPGDLLVRFFVDVGLLAVQRVWHGVPLALRFAW